MRCPVCGAEDSLSPLGDLDVKWDEIRLRFARPDLLDARPAFFASRGRACRSCGVLLPFLNGKQLEELREEFDELIPVAPDPKPGTLPSPECPS
ncbi:hypothetical protein [Amycolatopsis australiensis]|uniref:Uncharacterized protein n=1 Tax=Amycolatopsis australiensis TaxID=546364 RepID=A0A1K1R893_9PSEU|nr:hypothetical protein [Amycolatopsis australiensis]SFW68237.1 hypothetical protein SAMN04489730_2836 [Amycolatopsis australiensis]